MKQKIKHIMICTVFLIFICIVPVKAETETAGSSIGKDNNTESSQEIQTMIQAVTEAYPELKSNENYKTLMTDLTTTENQIATYRENYNTYVKEYR